MSSVEFENSRIVGSEGSKEIIIWALGGVKKNRM